MRSPISKILSLVKWQNISSSAELKMIETKFPPIDFFTHQSTENLLLNSNNLENKFKKLIADPFIDKIEGLGFFIKYF